MLQNLCWPIRFYWFAEQYFTIHCKPIETKPTFVNFFSYVTNFWFFCLGVGKVLCFWVLWLNALILSKMANKKFCFSVEQLCSGLEIVMGFFRASPRQNIYIQPENVAVFLDFSDVSIYENLQRGGKFWQCWGVIPGISEDRGLRFLKYEDWRYDTLKYEEVKTQDIKLIKIEDEEICNMLFNSNYFEHVWTNFAPLYC